VRDLVVLDQCLRDYRGHHYTYDAAVLRTAGRHGVSCRIIGSKELLPAISQELAAVPGLASGRKWYSYCASVRPRALRLLTLCAYSLVHGTVLFLQARNLTRLSKDLVIFAPNADLTMAWTCTLWRLLGSRKFKARWVLCFRYLRSRDTRRMAAADRLLFGVLRIMEQAAQSTHFSVSPASDSESVVEELARHTSLPLARLPILHATREVEISGDYFPADLDGIRFLYVGGGRSEQGVEVLMDALLLLKDELASGDCCMILQSNPHEDDVRALASWKRLTIADLPNVRVLRGSLSDKQYGGLMASSDVVLLPYLSEEYRWRTSGVLIEALANGKPVIAPKNTWMAAQLAGSGVVFDSGCPSALARAVRETLSGIGTLRVIAAARRRDVTEYHNPDRFFDVLMGQGSMNKTLPGLDTSRIGHRVAGSRQSDVQMVEGRNQLITGRIRSILRRTAVLVKHLRLTYRILPSIRNGCRNGCSVVIGAGRVPHPEWIPTDKSVLDVTSRSDFRRYWQPNSVSAFLAEHVWEHLAKGDARTADRNCFEFLKPGGRLRIAVPDGMHPDPAYIDSVRPHGSGPGAEDHKQLYNYHSLRAQLEGAGFSVELLEHWDENGEFHYREWSSADGHIRRSKRYDPRNQDGTLSYTSLIVDCMKPQDIRMQPEEF
jgi:predicted SAM-dependent methyltransferase/glycosyltransferase involved in cell wall biosynthesis